MMQYGPRNAYGQSDAAAADKRPAVIRVTGARQNTRLNPATRQYGRVAV